MRLKWGCPRFWVETIVVLKDGNRFIVEAIKSMVCKPAFHFLVIQDFERVHISSKNVQLDLHAVGDDGILIQIFSRLRYRTKLHHPVC